MPAAASKEQLSALTAVPSGLAKSRLKTSSRSKRTNSKRNPNVAIGNDQRVPWLKRPSIHHQIEVLEAVPEALVSTSSTSIPLFGGIVFTVSILDNFTSLAAVFDEYWIKEIEVLFSPTVTEVTASTGFGAFITSVDIDDGNAPTSLAQLDSYETSCESKANMSHYHRWQPQFAVATFSGAFTSYSPSSGWVDCGSPAVQHYGLKWGLGVSSTAQNFTVAYRLKVAFRALH